MLVCKLESGLLLTTYQGKEVSVVVHVVINFGWMGAALLAV